jgi:F0F1-type ATP synthase delta subunit
MVELSPLRNHGSEKNKVDEVYNQLSDMVQTMPDSPELGSLDH